METHECVVHECVEMYALSVYTTDGDNCYSHTFVSLEEALEMEKYWFRQFPDEVRTKMAKVWVTFS